MGPFANRMVIKETFRVTRFVDDPSLTALLCELRSNQGTMVVGVIAEDFLLRRRYDDILKEHVVNKHVGEF